MARGSKDTTAMKDDGEVARMVGKAMLNPAVTTIPASITLGVETRAREMAATGRTVYSFGAGEPDFDTPEPIKRAAEKALEAGQTKYTPAAGLQTLRVAIAEKLRRENGLKYSPAQVVISGGAKHSLFNVFMAICAPGDEVIIPSPYWLSYPEMVRVAGATPVYVRTSEAGEFKMTAEAFEAAITSKTKAVVINSPSNPTGAVYRREELRAIAEVAVRRGVLIVSDEIYEKMTYGGVEQVSIGSLLPEAFQITITVNGFSKAYAMTGWRLGYAAGPMEIVKAMIAFQSHSTSAPNTFAQYGAVEALQGDQSWVTRMVAAFDERRQYLHQRLTAMKGLSCVNPSGAFYMLPNIARFGMDSVRFAECLLEEEGVAVVPGVAFGTDAHVRLSYACSLQSIREGMERLEAFLIRL